MPCRIYYQLSWAARILLEARQHASSSFITLTYSPDALPENNSLSKRDSQLFLKRLRDHSRSTIRYYLCGEYGTRTKRPHYHLALFGFPSTDSEPLSKAWTEGFHTISELNHHRAKYLANYITKKLTGPLEYSDGRQPEFASMSRKPGLGHHFVPTLVATLKRHSLKPTPNINGTIRSGDSLEKLFPHGVPALIRMEKTVYPLSPYLIDLVLEQMGAPGRETHEWAKFTDARKHLGDVIYETSKMELSQLKSAKHNLRYGDEI